VNTQVEKPRIAPALERGLTILEVLGERDAPVAFGEFAALLGLSKASVARLLRVLRERGYVEKDPASGRRYRPGPNMSILRPLDARKEHLCRQAQPVLEALAPSLCNTVAVFYWSGSVFECIAKETFPTSLPMQQLGKVTREITRSPWGWLLASTLGEDELAVLLADDPHGDREMLAWGIAYVREHGYAFDDRRVLPIARRLAAPIVDHTGRVRAALALAGHEGSLPDECVVPCARALMNHASALSRVLGCTEGCSPVRQEDRHRNRKESETP